MTADAFQGWFADFYAAHFDPLVRFLVRLGAERTEAEDAAQSAMLALLQRHDDVRDGPAWIRVVARNNWLRAMRQTALTVRPESLDGQAETDGDPAGIVSRRLQRDRAARLVGELPPAQREIVALVVDGYSPAEIGELTGRSPAVVRSNLSHARRRLRQRLRPRLAA